MPSFSAVVTSHANPDGLRYVLGMLDGQTLIPDEIIALVSGSPDCGFHQRPNLNDWGHAKRAEGLQMARGDWVGFFNDDDSYSSDYLAKMLAAAAGADVVYCGWNTYPNCTFNLGSSTSGNFIVRREFGQNVGWTSRRYEADGDFIEACRANGALIRRIDEVLYAHNIQPWERYVGRTG